MTLRFERYVAIGDSSTEGLQRPGWSGRLPRLGEPSSRARGASAGRVALRQPGCARQALLGNPRGAAWTGARHEARPRHGFRGSNDILERGFDAGKWWAELESMMGALVGGKAVVLTFTLPDLTGVMPIGRFLAPRVRAMNATIREAAASTGARLIDFAAYSVGSDPRLWSEDRFHANAEGHARIAAALAQALGLPGTDDAWHQPMPERNARSRWTRMAESWSWYRHHLLDRLWPGSPVEGQCHPKRPRLEAVQPTDGFESL